MAARPRSPNGPPRRRSALLMVLVLVLVPALAGCFQDPPPPQLPRTADRGGLPDSTAARTGLLTLRIASTFDEPSILSQFQSVQLTLVAARIRVASTGEFINIPIPIDTRVNLVQAAEDGAIRITTEELRAATYDAVTLEIRLDSAFGKDGRERTLDYAPDGIYFQDNRTGLQRFSLRPDASIAFNFGLHVNKGPQGEYIQSRYDFTGVRPA